MSEPVIKAFSVPTQFEELGSAMKQFNVEVYTEKKSPDGGEVTVAYAPFPNTKFERFMRKNICVAFVMNFEEYKPEVGE